MQSARPLRNGDNLNTIIINHSLYNVVLVEPLLEEQESTNFVS